MQRYKKVVVMGLGLHGGGLAVSKWLLQQGATLTVTDLRTKKQLQPTIVALEKWRKQLKAKSIKYILGQHCLADFLNTDCIIKNPGVPSDSPYLQAARSKKIPIETDLSIFLREIKNPVIGVTGTRGKSTTATLIYELLRKKDSNTRLAGNIRVSALEILAQCKKHPKSFVILELSSWQLEDLPFPWSPQIAVLTNIMPDHLNRHGTMANYIKAKENILKFQKKNDCAVLNYDNPVTRGLGKKQGRGEVFYFSAKKAMKKGAFVRNNEIVFAQNGKLQKICNCDEIALKGQHNLENVLAAVTAAGILRVPLDGIRTVLKKFHGLSGRQELVYVWQNIKFYNDTTATTPEATIAALKTLGNAKNIVLIAGGADKKLKFNNLARIVKKTCKTVILLPGTATSKLEKQLLISPLKIRGERGVMKKAVQQAKHFAKPGDIVLLSPACASFGLFLHEFDRGEQFVKAVNNSLP